MPSILKIDYDSATKFCGLKHGYNRRFVDYVRSGVTPLSYRKFDQDKKRWFVHIKKLPQVVAMGQRYFDHVDYSALPMDIQSELVQTLNDRYRGRGNTGTGVRFDQISARANPYDVLYVRHDAPWPVIKAAYRALATMFHPDKGGSAEDFRAIQAAYDTLEKRNH